MENERVGEGKREGGCGRESVKKGEVECKKKGGVEKRLQESSKKANGRKR